MVRIYVTKNLQCGKKPVVWAPASNSTQKGKGTIIITNFCLMKDTGTCYVLKRNKQQITIPKIYTRTTMPSEEEANALAAAYKTALGDKESFDGTATCKPSNFKF